jgi:hypothetical protein
MVVDIRRSLMCGGVRNHTMPCASQAIISFAMATAVCGMVAWLAYAIVYVAIGFIVRLLRLFRRFYTVFDTVFTTTYTTFRKQYIEMKFNLLKLQCLLNSTGE